MRNVQFSRRKGPSGDCELPEPFGRPVSCNSQLCLHYATGTDKMTAIVYLNDAAGDFAFLTDSNGKFYESPESAAESVYPPKAGRLTMFSSGPENVHAVTHIKVRHRFYASAVLQLKTHLTCIFVAARLCSTLQPKSVDG